MEAAGRRRQEASATAEARRLAAEKAAARKREQWTIGQARSLVRQGYSVEHVVRTTGWDAEWVEDADKISE